MDAPPLITAESLREAIRAPGARVLQDGRNLTVRTRFDLPDGERADVAIKRFPAPSPARQKLDQLRGMPGKARRAWLAAEHLCARMPGSTPAPVAIVEEGPRAESWLVTRFEAGLTSLKAALIDRYATFGPCAAIMDLLRVVAENCARIHDAGFFHGDLGNQNIMLTDDGEPRVVLIDLNRCRLRPGPLSTRERARDLSRIHLPSDLRRVFLEMYWRGAVPPAPFLQAERHFRRRYALHCLTRRLRHPLRKPSPATDGVYPEPQNIWIWDTKSEQAIPALRPRDRHRHQSCSRVLLPLLALARSLPALYRHREHQRNIAFERPLLLFAERAFVSISADPDRFEQERAWLAELGCIGTHIRFYAHEPESITDFKIDAVRRLRAANTAVAISLVQHRDAVRRPQLWLRFCDRVLAALHDTVMWVEMLHAINRVKWGVWNFSELRRMLAVMAPLGATYPDVTFIGPSVIDFEWDYLAAALRCLPEKPRLHAVSCHLYVDRRGPPEALQGACNALGKLQLLRAMALSTPRTQGHLIVSEFNWPLRDTREWSPVGSPHVSPGDRFNDPSVTETDAAAYILRYLFIGLASGMADQMVFWSLAAHGFGLIDPGRTPDSPWRARPAFTAMKTFFHRLKHAHFISAVQRGEAGVWAMHFTSSAGQGIVTAWHAGPGFDAALPVLPFPIQSACDLYGQPIPVPERLTGSPVYLFQ